ncbi:MAG: aminomethyl-transferring glycine dehydrogenase subunit GcvPB [Candidatus Thermoplasmatota archaeon]|nr:aminomethyl-transferring glycine dehydrogenase subunit GcvPB [Candidatus Thermoplasmatota archaeon]
MTFRQARHDEPLLIELPQEVDGTIGPSARVPEDLRRAELDIPNLEEFQVARHFTRLSQMNYGTDSGFYPLGSCTMKYNPKYAESLAASPKARRLHPLQPEETVQGALQILFELQEMLARVAGMDEVSLQPVAGAQGELTGLLMARAYFEERGEDRSEVVLPDTAHGTNFASATMAGYDVVEIPSKEGVVDLGALEGAVSERTAAFMLTNPNTLGIFESETLTIAKLVHAQGALLYYDGANLNAILGKTNPGKMDFDLAHFNLHKTFSTPHGGGGPGAGPVGARGPLAEFLPLPLAAYDGVRYRLDYDRPKSIGKVRAFYGNFGVLLRAYAYITRMGADGLLRVTERAVLHTNYLRVRVEEHFPVPFGGLRKHEFVASAAPLKEKGVRAIDVAKRLIDYGIHPPTIYFPGLVEEALMIEPTESVTQEGLDAFVDALARIKEEDPDVLRAAPQNAAVARVDEVSAAKRPILSWRMMDR